LKHAPANPPLAAAPPRSPGTTGPGATARRPARRALAADEKGRPAAPGLSRAARQSIRRTVAFLGREADRQLLESIPGVGAVTAQAILAELPAPARFASAQQAAAYAGLAPREYGSGTSIRKRTRLSKAGNARLRKALYLPTLTAIRFNPLLRGFFERLVAAGKARMAAVGACMPKLLMIAYGVLKSRVPFDPLWALKQPS
jgi:transposase